MSRFHQIAKGTANVKRITFPFEGKEEPVGVRVMTGAELGATIRGAREYAEANGLKTPKAGDELYDLGLMVHTLLIACVDAADEGKRAPYFASAAEILENLDPDRITLLYEEQQLWQDECSPRPSTVSSDDYFSMVLRLAGWEAGQPDPLLRWRPTSRAIWARTIAAQFLNSLKSKSASTSDSGGTPGP